MYHLLMMDTFIFFCWGRWTVISDQKSRAWEGVVFYPLYFTSSFSHFFTLISISPVIWGDPSSKVKHFSETEKSTTIIRMMESRTTWSEPSFWSTSRLLAFRERCETTFITIIDINWSWDENGSTEIDRKEREERTDLGSRSDGDWDADQEGLPHFPVFFHLFSRRAMIFFSLFASRDDDGDPLYDIRDDTLLFVVSSLDIMPASYQVPSFV